MGDTHLAPSPIEDPGIVDVTIKHAAHHPTFMPPTLTPALTPEEPINIEIMAGKKLYTLERPDDAARELAAKLSLEEQVGYGFDISHSC
ncbi:hypothetical protein AOQ84DRAFT_203405 [Glonium stellatum]|uniref:Uncharacterized protein n=1 Tax=Glonium stellatum TaxID=574774 RepID=A0A8E2F5X8_9PEZI|nr:hypothetical protein AOQ84DRAFT_203405 [Glonium stellatum]